MRRRASRVTSVTAGPLPLPPSQLLRRREEPVGGEDLETGVLGRDEHDEHLCARRRSLFLREGDGGLVAVVAVGDQELLVVERTHDRGVVEPPEPGAVDLQIRLAVGASDRRGAVVEEEDRLELDARRAEEAETALLRASVRALVRQHRARLVRLDFQRRGDAEARACEPVRADVLLLERPDRGRLLDQDARLAPGLEVTGRLLLRLGQGQTDDVVRAALAQLLALLVRDHVVRRCDERLQRAGRLVVAESAKRLDHGHTAGNVPTGLSHLYRP